MSFTLMSFQSDADISHSFAVNFMIPYLISDTYVGLGSKVGFIFGSMAILSLIFTYWLVPECKGKSLEQIDFLFNNGVKVRDFGTTNMPSAMQPDTPLVIDKSGSIDHEQGGNVDTKSA